MHVLLASFDLFKDVGGGQTFYRNLILRNPEIQFAYLRSSEPSDAPRPKNARAIPCPSQFITPPDSSPFDLEVPHWLYWRFARANDVASAVAGDRFDVVDLPDYEQFGLFLRDAFDHHRVPVDRIVLGMHGRISTSLALNWSVEERDCIDLVQAENLQYQTVDARYFISASYREEWLDIDPVPAHVLDPLWFFDIPRLQAYQDRTGPPDLNFVGRFEKRKGPDIFIHLAWWLPRCGYRTANLIGPPNHDRNGTSSNVYLEKMIRNRRLTGVNLVRCMTPAELAQVYSSKSVTFVPSVYDTLNFVALESVLSGCPTVIGSGAGVCRYLCERFPEVPFEPIDVANWYDGVPRVEAILRNYLEYRMQLHDAVSRQDVQPRGIQLTDVYQASPACDAVQSARVADWYRRLSRFTSKSGEGHQWKRRCA
jgi:glycosyltransferase involved in cell wall biosynthesis